MSLEKEKSFKNIAEFYKVWLELEQQYEREFYNSFKEKKPEPKHKYNFIKKQNAT